MSEFTSCDDCALQGRSEAEGILQYCYYCVHQKRSDLFEPKQKDKIIDLSCIVGSDIDCEFRAKPRDNNKLHNRWEVNKLKEIVNDFYIIDGNYGNEQCRIREDHIHFYNKKENPLPDGLRVKLYLSNGTTQTHKSQDIRWDSGRPYIMGFEIIEVLPEYRYEWQDND